MRARRDAAAGRVRVIDLGRNRGKRAAMAPGIRATDAEIIAFVDSDSVLEPDALRSIVQGFADPHVGAICGHADVLNVTETWLTRMQAVRYFVAVQGRARRPSPLFGAVTCCSGCFSVYRREAIMPHLEWWENQTFLGVESTFGDDRSLTNCVLRTWKVRYESKAVSHTIVPDNLPPVHDASSCAGSARGRARALIVGSLHLAQEPDRGDLGLRRACCSR